MQSNQQRYRNNYIYQTVIEPEQQRLRDIINNNNNNNNNNDNNDNNYDGKRQNDIHILSERIKYFKSLIFWKQWIEPGLNIMVFSRGISRWCPGYVDEILVSTNGIEIDANVRYKLIDENGDVLYQDKHYGYKVVPLHTNYIKKKVISISSLKEEVVGESDEDDDLKLNDNRSKDGAVPVIPTVNNKNKIIYNYPSTLFL